MLLLASASPARRRLLEQAAIPHRVQVSGVDEDAITDPNPAQLVQLLARAKALAVWNNCTDPEITAVLGCDSVLAFEGEVFGKPADAEEAIARWLVQQVARKLQSCRTLISRDYRAIEETGVELRCMPHLALHARLKPFTSVASHSMPTASLVRPCPAAFTATLRGAGVPHISVVT